MLHLIDIDKAYGQRVLFEGLSWHLGHNQRIGLVGPNGVGKTTLARIIVGEESPDAGEVVYSKQLRVGYLVQEVRSFAGKPVLEAVTDAATELKTLEAEKLELERRLADGQDEPAVLERYARAQARFELLGGYGLEAEARRILAGLGFSEARMAGPANELSGGWLMRVELARLLLTKPDLLLLDEPTNHLDLETLVWFEEYVADYPGTLVIISHDRYLLNRVAERIVELGRRGVEVYPGNFDRYVELRAQRRAQQLAAVDKQDREIAKMERFIARNRVRKDRAAAAQSRLKALAKIERLDRPEGDPREIRFRFPSPPRSGRHVVTLQGVVKRYGDHVVYDGLDLEVERGQRLALVGPNGAGKSTLLKLLAGEIRHDGGSIRFGPNVSRSYFAQHQKEALVAERTALEELETDAHVDVIPRCRGILGAFGFSGNDVDKLVEVLSGGEKSRLALAKMLLEPANLLLLDEPTNHLDLTSRMVLEQALLEFDGTLVVISHDRQFINIVATEVIEILPGSVRRFPGDYDYYVFKREQLAASAPAPSLAATRQAAGRRELERERKRREAELRNELFRATKQRREEHAAVEDRIQQIEAATAALHQRMADPEFYADAESMREAYEKVGALEAEQEELLERWELLGTEIERAEAEHKQKLEDLT